MAYGERFDVDVRDVRSALKAIIDGIFNPVPTSAYSASADYTYHRTRTMDRNIEVLYGLRSELQRRGLGGDYVLNTARSLPMDLRSGWSQAVGERLEALARRGIL
jgi:hypothetical protein